jgi:hypothetical protein
MAIVRVAFDDFPRRSAMESATLVRADKKLAAFLELERVTRETLGHRGNRMIGLLERKLNPLRKKPAT